MYIDKHRITRNLVNQRILAACMFHKLNAEQTPWKSKPRSTPAPAPDLCDTTADDSHRLQQTLMSTVDTIMDAYRSYSISFNQDADFNQNLSVTSPCLMTEQIIGERGHKTKPLFAYRGRVSSRRWSLVVGSSGQQIEFLMLPTAKLLHLTCKDKLVEPFFILNAYEQDNEVLWKLKDACLPKEQISQVYQEAFRAFVEIVYTDSEQDADLLSKDNAFGNDIVQNKYLEGAEWLLRDQNKETVQDLNWNTPTEKHLLVFDEELSEILGFEESKQLATEPAKLAQEDQLSLPEEETETYAGRSRIRSVAAQCPLSIEEIISFVAKLNCAAKTNTKTMLAEQSTEASAETNTEEESEPENLQEQGYPNQTPVAQTSFETSIGPIQHILIESINSLLEESQVALSSITANGAQAFQMGLLEEVASGLTAAFQQEQVVEHLTQLKIECERFGGTEIFIRMCSHEDGISPPKQDQTFLFCDPERRLHLLVEQSLASLVEIGIKSFETLNIARVNEANFHAQNLKSFQKLLSCSPEQEI